MEKVESSKWLYMISSVVRKWNKFEKIFLPRVIIVRNVKVSFNKRLEGCISISKFKEMLIEKRC